MRLIYPWIGCGECRQCREGHDNRCAAGQNLGVARHGGYAEYILVPDEKYLVDIDGIDPSWAATLACSGLTAYSAVDKVLPLEPDEPVVIFGAGGLGLTAIAILRARGHRNICAVDVAERNLALAREMGASSTVLSGPGSGADDIRSAAGGPASAVVDFVNNGVTATSAFEVLAKAGSMIQVGLFGGEVTIPTAMLALRMIRIEGSFVGTLVAAAGSGADRARRGAAQHPRRRTGAVRGRGFPRPGRPDRRRDCWTHRLDCLRMGW